ncbi:MAG TPA: hypothetical protein VMJ64_12700 [Anaerolineales bacterium]|nr:hypothetical protein [Anaerolineales bacterium]
MPDALQIGDRVRIYLDSEYWKSEGWFEGTVARIDPYSEHRSFYWVQLDIEVQAARGGRTSLVSVLNPARIVKA